MVFLKRGPLDRNNIIFVQKYQRIIKCYILYDVVKKCFPDVYAAVNFQKQSTETMRHLLLPQALIMNEISKSGQLKGAIKWHIPKCTGYQFTFDHEIVEVLFLDIFNKFRSFNKFRIVGVLTNFQCTQ